MYASFDWHTEKSFSTSMSFVELKCPRLYWAHNMTRVNGASMTPSIASRTLESYDASKSFKQNMNDNKYYRIYDSGILLFKLAAEVNSKYES